MWCGFPGSWHRHRICLESPLGNGWAFSCSPQSWASLPGGPSLHNPVVNRHRGEQERLFSKLPAFIDQVLFTIVGLYMTDFIALLIVWMLYDMWNMRAAVNKNHSVKLYTQWGHGRQISQRAGSKACRLVFWGLEPGREHQLQQGDIFSASSLIGKRK